MPEPPSLLGKCQVISTKVKRGLTEKFLLLLGGKTMFTTIGFSESQDAGGAEVAMAAVADQHMRTNGDDFIIGEFNRLIGGLACIGTNGIYALFVSPSIRRVNPHYISPTLAVLYPSTEIFHSVFFKSPIILDEDESLNARYFGTPGGAEQASIVAWLSDGDIQQAEGRIYTIRATCTQTLVAGAWNASNIALVDDLPVGTYDVVGGRIVCDEGVAARFIPIGSKNRPGMPCAHDEACGGDKEFRHGALGVWFSFHTNQLPMIEILGSAAEASDTYNIYMDIIKK